MYDKQPYISAQQAVVDVRTPEEYRDGHVSGSVNIPLQELAGRMDEVKALAQPVVLCCASGSRSAMACHWLRTAGIDCRDGGSWMDVQANRTQTP